MAFFKKQQDLFHPWKELDVFAFGKYKDKIVNSICKTDPEYIGWCYININNFKLEDSQLKYLAEGFLTRLKYYKKNYRMSEYYKYVKLCRHLLKHTSYYSMIIEHLKLLTYLLASNFLIFVNWF